MKKLIIPILILMVLPLLFACNNENTDTANTDGDFILYAIIEKIEAGSLEVKAQENQGAHGTYIVNIYDGTEYSDSENGKLSRSDLKIGDEIKITYNGQVTRSLPPQITALKIQKQ